MPILSRIGRRSIKVRLLIWSIYALLVAGAVTMVYPFLLMLAGSTKSNVDASESSPVPRFLTSDAALWAKHVEGLFNESLDMMRQVHHADAVAFEKVQPPAEPNRALADAWLSFLQEADLPHYSYTIGYLHAPVTRGVIPLAGRAFKGEMAQRFGGDIDRLNRAFATEFAGWRSFFVRRESFLLRREKPLETPLGLALRAFKARQPLDNRYYFTVEGFYKQYLKNQYTRDIAAYNREHGTSHGSYAQVRLERRLPGGPGRTDRERSDWKEFARTILSLLWIRADREAAPPYREFLRARYGDVGSLNRRYGTHYDSFDQVPLIQIPPGTIVTLAHWQAFLEARYGNVAALNRAHGTRHPSLEAAASLHAPPWEARALSDWRAFLEDAHRDVETFNRRFGTDYASFDSVPLILAPSGGGVPLSDWDAFLQGWEDPDTGRLHILPAAMIRIHSVDFQFRDHLRRRFRTLERLNAALGTGFGHWLEIVPPQRDAHYLAFQRNTGSLRTEFVVRNYLTVFDYIAHHGRGILNTAIYCSLAVLGALLVNPLAAYALSRYKPPSAYKVLLFLMLTMAFPPMVTQIPVFLMLREFNMLNTFWALILPGLANGYSIFLLKGFFDSLPKELYESAQLDGAGEFRIFWRITMSLSKPILAVIALNAFTVAYANFMFALLICQDQNMWTLMVWLYNLQQDSGQGVIFASLLIAAVPVFVMFAFCQKVIMRGIVVPVEK
jgi:multiple sugar transport system permease protein